MLEKHSTVVVYSCVAHRSRSQSAIRCSPECLFVYFHFLFSNRCSAPNIPYIYEIHPYSRRTSCLSTSYRHDKMPTGNIAVIAYTRTQFLNTYSRIVVHSIQNIIFNLFPPNIIQSSIRNK